MTLNERVVLEGEIIRAESCRDSDDIFYYIYTEYGVIVFKTTKLWLVGAAVTIEIKEQIES